MKAHVYIGRDITIPDAELPRIVRAVKRDRVRRLSGDPQFHEHTNFKRFPVQVDEIIRKARDLGILKIDDLSTDSDDDRRWWQGRLIESEEWFDIIERRQERKQ